MLRFLSRFLPESIQGPLRTLTFGLFGAIGVGLCIGAAVMLYDPLSIIVQTGSVPESTYSPLFIAGVMLFIGIGFISTSVANYRRQKAYREAENLEEPWTTREAWQSSTLTHENTQSWGGLTAVFLGGGGVLAGWAIWSAILTAETPEWGVLFVLVFPLAGAFMAVQMVKAYKRKQRFGISKAELETMPVRMGQRMLARVEAAIDRSEFPEHGAQVQLSCYRRTARYESSGSGKNKSRTVKERTHLLWRGEKQMRAMKFDSNGAHIPVSFETPEDMPRSTAIKRSKKYLARTGKSDIIWEVAVRAEIPGTDYKAHFEVPVYELEGQAPENNRQSAPENAAAAQNGGASAEQSEQVLWDLKNDQEALRVSTGEDEADSDDPYAEYVVEPNLTEPISKNISLKRVGGQGVRIRVEPDRSLKGIAKVALMAAVGIGLVVATPFFFVASVLGSIFALVIGLAFSWGAWVAWTQETTITVANGEVDVQVKGGGGKSERFPVMDVEDIDVRISGTRSNSDYQIIVQKRGDDKGFNSDTAQGIMDTMGQVFGQKSMSNMKSHMSDMQNRVAHLDNLHNKQEADWLAQQLRDAVEAEKRYA